MISQENRILRRTILRLAALAASLSLPGCIIIPHPRNIATAGGIERKKPKLEFLKNGVTTKADVERELGDFETSASQARFVWARWQQVKVQTEWFMGGGPPPGAAGGSVRSWIIKNVLAGFDDNDVMVGHRICSEGEIIGCINAMLGYTNPAEGEAAALLLRSWRGRGSARDGRVIFEEGKVTFEHFRKPKQNFVVPLSAIERLSEVHGASSEILRLALHFRENTKPVETLHLEASPAETIRLVRLVQFQSR